MIAKDPGYRTPARLLHWTMAVLVVMTIPAGYTMIQTGLPRGLQDGLFIFHKNIGVVLLILITLRLIYRLWRRPPAEPETLHPMQKLAAGVVHTALYVMLFVMPLAGYIRVRAEGFPIEYLDRMGVPPLVPRSDALAHTAETIHFYGSFVLVALIGMHVGAALLHWLILRDGIVARMWPPVQPKG